MLTTNIIINQVDQGRQELTKATRYSILYDSLFLMTAFHDCILGFHIIVSYLYRNPLSRDLFFIHNACFILTFNAWRLANFLT